MIGKLLERLVNRYYSKDKGNRSVLLVQGEGKYTITKVSGTNENLKDCLYTAMKNDATIREIVNGAWGAYHDEFESDFPF